MAEIIMEPIVERIAVWIEEAIDGVQDPGKTLTLRAVRPKILDWEASDFKHGDVVMEFKDVKPYDITSTSRLWLGTWKLYGIITTLPANTNADAVLEYMAKTIKNILLNGNKRGRACGGIAVNIDCPEVAYSDMAGGVVAEMTVQVRF